MNYTYYQILELRKWKEWIWVAWSYTINVTRDMHTGLSEILNHNEQSPLLLGAYICSYTKLQTWWQIHCCQGWINSLSQALLHSQCSNTFNISTVIMLRFWLCQFNTSILARFVIFEQVFCLIVKVKYM